MNQLIDKLNHKLGDRELARKLVAAGYTTPRDIKAASNQALKAVQGIGDATVAVIRQRIG